MSRILPFDHAVRIFVIHKPSVNIVHKQNCSCTSPPARGKVVQAITHHYQSIAFVNQLPLFRNMVNSCWVRFRRSEFPCDYGVEYLTLAKVRNKMIDRGTKNTHIPSRATHTGKEAADTYSKFLVQIALRTPLFSRYSINCIKPFCGTIFRIASRSISRMLSMAEGCLSAARVYTCSKISTVFAIPRAARICPNIQVCGSLSEGFRQLVSQLQSMNDPTYQRVPSTSKTTP